MKNSNKPQFVGRKGVYKNRNSLSLSIYVDGHKAVLLQTLIFDSKDSLSVSTFTGQK